MLRTNLSTRPFYNERAVRAALALVAILVVAITAWQITRVVRLSRYKTDLSASIRREQQEADDFMRRASDVRRSLNTQELAVVGVEAKEANGLIERRTFSWTALFNQLEATLPEDVMLTAVRPEFTDGRTYVSLEIQARRSDDIGTFWDRLEKTGQFRDVQWSNETVTDDGLVRMAMSATYTGPANGTAAVRPANAPPQPQTAPQGGGRR